MTEIVPSFLAKLDRAEHHLIDLDRAIEDYGGTGKDSRPYTVRQRIEKNDEVGRRTTWRLHFTRSVDNTTVPLIVADAIYNLRSSLDHLMNLLVAPKRRASVIFPIFWREVWDPEVPGENEQRIKDRQRWTSIESSLSDKPEAVAFLKRLQPPDEAGYNQSPHGLRMVNQFSNTDRHKKLVVVAHGVQGLIIRWQLADGTERVGFAKPETNNFLEDDAEIRNVPEGAVYVEAFGPPEIVIRTGMKYPDGRTVNVPVLDFLRENLTFIRKVVVPKLIPYLWVGPS